MSTHTARWLLWLGLMVMLPVPFFLAETGVVPPARIGMLGIISLAVWIVEGSAGVVRITTALLLAQTLAYAGALWLVAALAVRALRGVSPAARRRVTLAALALGLLLTASRAFYRDPFRAHALYTTLRHVYE